MKSIGLITILFLFSSCKQTDFTVGSYEASSGDLIDKVIWFIKGKRSIRGGTRLELRDDKTFEFQTCGCQSKGTWTLNNDTLYLNTRSNLFADSSFFATAVKNCSSSHYRLVNNRLFRLQYEDSEYIECLEYVQ